MIRSALSLGLTTLLLLGSWQDTTAQSLRGSRASLIRQNQQARTHDYTYLKTPADVKRFVDAGYLVRIKGNADYRLSGVSFPYARPEVEVFLERLSNQYRSACGEKLVVTSLVRPQTRQPPNASPLSVHPTGMAIDLRRSAKAQCRNWLERVLLQLERGGVLDATREMRPPHYHVALFPRPYMSYVNRITANSVRIAASGNTSSNGDARGSANSAMTAYLVRRGDSLWTIARRHGITVEALQRANDLRSPRILAGQRLQIPESESR